MLICSYIMVSYMNKDYWLLFLFVHSISPMV